MWKHEIITRMQNTKWMQFDIQNLQSTHCFYLGNFESFENMKLDDSITSMPYESVFIELVPPNLPNINYRKYALYAREHKFGEATKIIIYTLANVLNHVGNHVGWCYLPHIVCIDKDTGCFGYGSIRKAIENSHIELPMFESENDIDEQDVSYEAANITVYNFFVLTNLLACKNVTAVPVDPPEKLNKKRIKNGKEPLYRYHVLTVDTSMGRKKTDGGPVQNVGIMPVHQHGQKKRPAERAGDGRGPDSQNIVIRMFGELGVPMKVITNKLPKEGK